MIRILYIIQEHLGTHEIFFDKTMASCCKFSQFKVNCKIQLLAYLELEHANAVEPLSEHLDTVLVDHRPDIHAWFQQRRLLLRHSLGVLVSKDSYSASNYKYQHWCCKSCITC